MQLQSLEQLNPFLSWTESVNENGVQTFRAVARRSRRPRLVITVFPLNSFFRGEVTVVIYHKGILVGNDHLMQESKGFSSSAEAMNALEAIAHKL